MDKPKLRVGLLLDGMSASSWSYRMIEQIRRSHYADVCLVVKPRRAMPAGSKKEGPLARIKTTYAYDIGRIFETMVRKSLEGIHRHLIERKRFLRDSEEIRDLSDLLRDVQVIDVKVNQTKWSDSLGDEDLQRIRACNIDVLIRVGFRILRGGVLTAAKYGIWSYHHGDNHLNRGGPPGFWESLEAWPETGSILQILTEDVDNGKVLYRSYSWTNPISVTDNKSNYYAKSLAFIPRKLRELWDDGERLFFEKVAADNADPVVYSRRLYRKPGNAEYAKLIAGKMLTKFAALVRSRLYSEQWILLFDIRDTFSSSLWRYKRLLPPKDRFWADPHAVRANGRYYIFIEQWLFTEDKGHIAVIEMDDAGHSKPPVPIIERSYHMSYPFIFEYQDAYYMIPETASNSTVQLFKCVEFPYKWEFQYNLMEGVRVYDATLLYRNGRWWMFANMVENAGASSWDELFVFHADSPLSKHWTPHECNPVVSDCKSARSAGRFFESGGMLYRPSQNSSVRYGYGFNLARVEVLDEREYKEEIVSRVEPKWAKDLLATHSLSRAGALHVIDAQIRRRRWFP